MTRHGRFAIALLCAVAVGITLGATQASTLVGGVAVAVFSAVAVPWVML